MSNGEVWEWIPGYEGLYQASTLGRIKSLITNKILKDTQIKSGYKIISLSKNKREKLWRVHKLIALTFIPNPNNYPVINHKNGIKNDNRADNLEWCTYSYNSKHAYDKKLRIPPWLNKKGKNHNCSKKIEQYDLQGNFIRVWDSIADASREFNVSDGNIIKCCKKVNKTVRGYIWKYCEERKEN